MNGLWDRMNFAAILRSKFMKDRFRYDQRLVGYFDQVVLIRLWIIHADMDQRKPCRSHYFAQRSYPLDVRIQEDRGFQVQLFRVCDNLPRDGSPLKTSNNG